MVDMEFIGDRTEAYHATCSIVAKPHGLFPGWFHGAWIDAFDETLAVTVSAYPTKWDAISIASKVFNDKGAA
jgi:hypothetical protein